MSWRDETPPAVQEALDSLANEGLNAAEHFLAQNGEFYPFALTLSKTGDIRMVGGEPGEGEHPSSTAVLDLLYEALAAERESLSGAAFIAAVETHSGDAIRVEVEHRDGGPALVLLLPYRRKRMRKAVELGQLTAAAGDRRVWA